jgi:hypothetical protein
MGIKEMVQRLDADSSIRAKIMYLPHTVKDEYGLTDAELAAISEGKFDQLDLTDDEQAVLKRRLNYHGI